MENADQRNRFFQIAALCGALGVGSGYAIFLISDEILADPWHFFPALLGAAFISYIIEWLRDLIRTGEIETEMHPIIRSIGTFVVVLLFELFIAGFDGGIKLGAGSILRAANSLLGDQAISVGIPWTVVLVAGMWMVTGALLAGWLSLQIGRDEAMPMSQHILHGARWGTLGGLVIAPAAIGLYVLGGRTIVAINYFGTRTQDASKQSMDLATVFHASHANAFLILFDLPIGLLHLAANRGPIFFWLCYLALYLAIGVLFALQKRWADRSVTSFISLLMFGLIFCVFSPVVRSLWVVFSQLLLEPAPPRSIDLSALPVVPISPLHALLDAIFLGAVVWGIPGLLLGGLVPLLKRAGRSPQSWAFIGYGAAALLIVASVVTWHAWPLVPAAIALGSGLLFQRGMPVKEFWPFAALCVAIGVSGAMSVSQRLTFSSVLFDLHQIDDLTPTLPGAQSANSAPNLIWDGRSFNITEEEISHAIRQASEKRKKLEEARDESQRSAKILEVAIAGSVGFWTTVGLLACWSMHEREHSVEPE